MKHLGIKGRQWLKAFHLLCAAGWTGAAICLMLLNMALKADNGGMLHGIDVSMKFIDDWIIIPAATGCLITGIIYALFTNWGFFRHNWIIVKWIIIVLSPISASLGSDALKDPAYMDNKIMNMIFGSLQMASIIFAIFISTLKPWKKKNDQRTKE